MTGTSSDPNPQPEMPPMLPIRHAMSFLAGALLLVLMSACQSTPESTTRPATTQPDGSSSPAPSPMSERERARQQAWQEAIAGLNFDSGRVIVEEAIVADGPELYRSKMAEGREKLQINHKTPAVKAFAEAVRSAPQRIEPYMALGQAMIVKGKTDLAEACFRSALDLDPEHVEAHTELAMTLSRERHRAEAIESMRRVLDLDPDNGFAHERLAIWHYYDGDFASAWEHVDAARQLGHPMPPQFINLLSEKMADPAAG
jgi:tetratricopeptide (TPR) repeat protein